MKKVVGALLFLVISLTYSKVTYGATTFAYDKTVRGRDATYQSGNFYSKARDVETLNFSYIKRIKIDLEYQSGKYQNDHWLEMKLSNIQVGLRVINHPKQLLYITVGGMEYVERVETFEELSAHEADGGLIGIDYVGLITDKLQIELNYQKSLNVSSRYSCFDWIERISSMIKSPAELDIYKIKLRYLLTDNLGLTINFRWLDLNLKDPLGSDVAISDCSLGFVYRF